MQLFGNNGKRQKKKSLFVYLKGWGRGFVNKEIPLGRALGYLELFRKRKSSSAGINKQKECSLKILWL